MTAAGISPQVFCSSAARPALNAIGDGERGGLTVPPPSATQPSRITRTHEHATVTGRAIEYGRVVADLASFLSAFVLAQPSPGAVFGSG
jgi:hypothetical protein